MGANVIHNVPKEFNVALDIKRSVSNTNFEVVEGDTENYINITLTDDGTAVDVEANRVVAVFTHSKGCYLQDSDVEGGGVSIDDNVITIHLKTESFSVGMVECELRIYGELYALSTTPTFNFSCRASLLSDETVAAHSNIDLLSGLIMQTGTALTNAQGMMDELSQMPFIDVVYSNQNPATAVNLTTSKIPGEYMGIFCSASGRPESASDYTWVHLAQPPHVTQAQLDTNGNIKFTLSDNSTLTVSDFASSVQSRVSTAVSAITPVTARNVVIQPSAFSASNALRDYSYCAAVPCSGMQSTYIGSVVFSAEDAESGNFAPVANAGTDCVYIYARCVPSAEVTIPLVKGER